MRSLCACFRPHRKVEDPGPDAVKSCKYRARIRLTMSDEEKFRLDRQLAANQLSGIITWRIVRKDLSPS
jgi:hypothetical protein